MDGYSQSTRGQGSYCLLSWWLVTWLHDQIAYIHTYIILVCTYIHYSSLWSAPAKWNSQTPAVMDRHEFIAAFRVFKTSFPQNLGAAILDLAMLVNVRPSFHMDYSTSRLLANFLLRVNETSVAVKAPEASLPKSKMGNLNWALSIKSTVVLDLKNYKYRNEFRHP